MSTKSARNRRYKRRKAASKHAPKEKRKRVQSLLNEGSYTEAMSCARKTAYSTKRQAEKTAIRKAIATSCDLRTYQCPYCGKWHLTHATSRPKYDDLAEYDQRHYEKLELQEKERDFARKAKVNAEKPAQARQRP